MSEAIEARVKQVILRTYNVKSIRVVVDAGIQFKPGQFLQATLTLNNKEVSHYLSISSSPTEAGYIEFTKKLTGSDFSQALNMLKPQDVIKIKYPFGKFTFEGEYKKIMFLSGGIGITPIRSIIKSVVDRKLAVDMVLFYANRTSRDIAFKDDFDLMQKNTQNLNIVYIINTPEEAWGGRVGYIKRELIEEVIPGYKDYRFYLCGPAAMVSAMEEITEKQLHMTKDYIITENFTGY